MLIAQVFETLDALRGAGWSYSAGWSNPDRAYVVRIWKPRNQPFVTSWGVTLFLHSLSGSGPSLVAALQECLRQMLSCDSVDTVSSAEKEYCQRVARLDRLLKSKAAR